VKKTISLILCLIMCVALFAACGDKAANTKTDTNTSSANQADIGNTNTGSSTTADSVATPPPEDAEYYDELRLSIGDKIAVIDALTAGTGTSQTPIAFHLMYDTLVYQNIQNEYEPCLATEWSCNEDATVWNFKLRDDVTFHNGEHFTADDVIFTITSAHDVVGGPIYTRFNQVKEIVANGDYEVTMTLEAPNFDFVYDCSDVYGPMLNREAYESGVENGTWVGTGPYKLVELIPNDSLTFEANEDYWGTKPLAKKFVMRYIAEETARNIMLENDEFDFVGINGVYIPQYEADDRFVMNSYVMNNCNVLSFNFKKTVTADKNFRLAVCYGIDVQAAVDIALNGYGKVHDTGAVWGNTTAYKDETIPAYTQDVELAKEYLAKSCYNGEEIELWAGMAQTIKLATVYQQQLTELGINAKVHECDGPSLTAATMYENNECDIVVTSCPVTSLGSSVKPYFTPGNRGNVSLYENDEIVSLFEQAAGTADGPEREAMYKRIQQICYEDVVYMPTHHMAMYIAAQKGTGGGIYFPNNYHDYGTGYRLKLAE